MNSKYYNINSASLGVGSSMRIKCHKIHRRASRLFNIVYEPSEHFGRTISMENIRFTDYEDECLQLIKPMKRGDDGNS